MKKIWFIWQIHNQQDLNCQKPKQRRNFVDNFDKDLDKVRMVSYFTLGRCSFSSIHICSFITGLNTILIIMYCSWQFSKHMPKMTSKYTKDLRMLATLMRNSASRIKFILSVASKGKFNIICFSKIMICSAKFK